jgi:hypothetical protein
MFLYGSALVKVHVPEGIKHLICKGEFVEKHGLIAHRAVLIAAEPLF